MTQKTQKNLTALLRYALKRQSGVFTAAEAARFGIANKTLRKLAQDERVEFVQAFRGVYQATDAPYEESIAAAWRRAGSDAIASHETAMSLYDLGDIEPRKYEFTVPRAARARRPGRGFRLHTATTMPASRWVRGVPVTSPARAIIDSGPLGDLTEIAVAQAIGRGLATEEELRTEAADRPRYVRDAIERALRGRAYYAGYI
jgi:predicted transcriptional regulator of viral defense system